MRKFRFESGHWASLLAAGLILTVGATACSSVRNGLGSTDSDCYRVLPTANGVMNGHGHLLGEKLTTLGWMKANTPILYSEAASGGSASEKVCLLGFSGPFRPGQVTKPLHRSSGRLAVVVVTYPQAHLLGTVIFRKLPLRFVHTFLHT